jgi:hypothetical protein
MKIREHGFEPATDAVLTPFGWTYETDRPGSPAWNKPSKPAPKPSEQAGSMAQPAAAREASSPQLYEELVLENQQDEAVVSEHESHPVDALPSAVTPIQPPSRSASPAPPRPDKPDAVDLRVGVEELALEYYYNEGRSGWRGLHCEGGPVLAIFALLMWDVLFTDDVPNTFATPYQDGPLDLDSPEVFYRNRRHLIQARIAQLAVLHSQQVCSEVGDCWRKHYGQVCRGLRWNAYPLQLLQLVAVGLGAPSLACLCDALCWDHRHLTGGMPDLLLWRCVVPAGNALPKADISTESAHGPDLDVEQLAAVNALVQVRLVEVKGPRDKLSEKQHHWLRLLLRAGVNAGVCKIIEKKSSKKKA